MRIFSRNKKLVIGVQCARVECVELAESELPVEKVGELVEVMDALDLENELGGPSSTLGLGDRVKAKGALALVRTLARALENQLRNGVDVNVEVPWALKPAIYCDGCSAEMLPAVGDNLAEWWDDREVRA